MKVFVLGIDGLEYELVEKFDLENLKQLEYGKVSIPKECFIIAPARGPRLRDTLQPYTPLVWSTLLTGKTPSQTNINKVNFIKWDNRLLQFLRENSGRIGLNRVKGKTKLLKALGFKRRYHNKDDFRVKTIFDFAKNPIDISVPCYSKDWKFKLKADKNDVRGFFEESLSDFKVMREETLRRVTESWDLFFSYTRHLDISGHLFFGRRIKMWENYALVDELAGQIKDRLRKGTLLLIVSDHGMNQLENTTLGKHGEYAYYSGNMSLGLKAPSITDFYEIIKEKLSSDQ